MSELDHVRLEVVRTDPGMPLPGYAHEGDAGLDLASAEDLELAPGERRAVRTGLRIAVPMGWVGLVHPRSGLSLRHGITLVNTPGTIDAGYRGELQVPLINLGRDPYRINRGDRIAQLLLQRVGHADVVEVEDFESHRTVRGQGGFGSSGT